MAVTTVVIWMAAAGLCPGAGGSSRAPARLAPAPRPDVQRTSLVIRPDLRSGRLRLSATLEIANPSGDSEFHFLLAGWYDSVLVRSRSGAAVVSRDGGEVRVRVRRPAIHERLVFSLSGTPGQSGGDDRPVLADSSVYLLWSDRFYPADFDDWSAFAAEIELPPGFRVFAPGRRVSAADRGPSHVERWETTQPIRVASVIADARWVETDRTVAGRHLRTLLYPGSGQYADRIFGTSADVLDFYASRFGPYQFDGFTFATVEGIYARRAVVGGVIYEPAYLARELATTGSDAHETALLWWGYTIAGRGPGSYQWTEGFGDYAEVLYDDARGLPTPRIIEAYRSHYLRDAGDSEPPITALRGPRGDEAVHGRLPWVMHLLRFAVGDSAFDHGVRLLFERWRFRTFTLDEFVATLAQGTGRDLGWWRDEWLLRRGVPALAWHADTAADSGGYRIAVHVRQTGALYHLPLEIGIVCAGGMRLERVRLDDRSGDYQLWSPVAPLRVVIDPRGWLLARITPE